MHKIKEVTKKLLIILFWLLLWQTVISLLNKNLLIAMPTPVTTVQSFLRLSGKREFWQAASCSLLRVVAGFCCAVIIGTVCAVISHRFKVFSDFFSPILRLMRAVPVAAFIILVFLWVKRDYIPQLIAFLTALPIMWTSTEKALEGVDKGLLEMSKVMSLSRVNTFRYIIFPSVKPTYSANLITGLGFSWKSGVAAEVICRSKASLGDMLIVSQSSIEYSEVFAITAVIIIFSVVLEGLLKLLLRKEAGK